MAPTVQPYFFFSKYKSQEVLVNNFPGALEMTLSDKQRWTTPCQKLMWIDIGLQKISISLMSFGVNTLSELGETMRKQRVKINGKMHS